MIQINKDEAKYLREHGVIRFSNRGVVRLMRQDSKRKHYYACESRKVLEALEAYR